MVRLVAFDLDGTLVDSRRDIAESANSLLALYDAAPLPDAAVVAMVGEGARLLVSRVLDAAGVVADVDQALARFVAIYDGRLTHHTQLYPGVASTLADLASRGVAMGVLTNKPQRLSERLIAHFRLTSYFLNVIGGDGLHARKPDPGGLHALMAAARAEGDETLMVGDSWVDLETARRAGARACYAAYGFGLLPDEAAATGIPRIDRVEAVLSLANGQIASAR